MLNNKIWAIYRKQNRESAEEKEKAEGNNSLKLVEFCEI